MESPSELIVAAETVDEIRDEIRRRSRGESPDERFSFVIAAILDLSDEL